MLKWFKGSATDHPLLDAKEAKRIADALSATKNPVNALDEGSHWLTSIKATTELVRHRRFELICLVDAATRKAQTQLIDVYLADLKTKRHQEKHIWNTANEFWGLLVNGYLTCAQPSRDSSNVPPKFMHLLPLLTTRGMRALRYQMKWVSIRYGTLRSDSWAEYGRLLWLAESAGADVADKPLAIYPGDTTQTSPRDEFLRAMAFWIALPGTLSPVEQDIAERLIVQLTAKFRFSVEQADDCDYFFDLHGTQPPLRFVRLAPMTATTRYFSVGEARQAVKAMHAMASSIGELPAGIDCGPGAEINVVLRVLNHLLVNWVKNLPPRAAARRKTAGSLKAAHGYPQVLAVVMKKGAEALDFSQQLLPESWVTEDLSVGGCGAIVPAGTGEQLRVGTLVALQPAAEAIVRLSIGVIRRVSDHGERQHRLGIQIISNSAVPVYLRTYFRTRLGTHLGTSPGARQGRDREPAILLREQPSANGSLYLLARRDVFSGREPVEASFGSKENPHATVILEPAGVVESGNDFDWLRYKMPQAADH